ncbi:MAG: hypothetical protein AAGH40_04065 [Verrucomicrobiota bacterium]
MNAIYEPARLCVLSDSAYWENGREANTRFASRPALLLCLELTSVF